VNKRSKLLKEYFNDLINESERGCVIVAAAMIEDVISNMIDDSLLPPLNSEDQILAKDSSFSFKINLAYRIGLLSEEAAKSFHLIRKIRNDFAHKRENANFNSQSVKERVKELFNLAKPIIDSFKQDMSENNIGYEEEGIFDTLGYQGAFSIFVAYTISYLAEKYENKIYK